MHATAGDVVDAQLRVRRRVARVGLQAGPPAGLRVQVHQLLVLGAGRGGQEDHVEPLHPEDPGRRLHPVRPLPREGPAAEPAVPRGALAPRRPPPARCASRVLLCVQRLEPRPPAPRPRPHHADGRRDRPPARAAARAGRRRRHAAVVLATVPALIQWRHPRQPQATRPPSTGFLDLLGTRPARSLGGRRHLAPAADRRAPTACARQPRVRRARDPALRDARRHRVQGAGRRTRSQGRLRIRRRSARRRTSSARTPSAATRRQRRRTTA